MEDLDASLEQVAVCCPKTRCVYRCRQRMASELLRKASPDAGGFVGASGGSGGGT